MNPIFNIYLIILGIVSFENKSCHYASSEHFHKLKSYSRMEWTTLKDSLKRNGQFPVVLNTDSVIKEFKIQLNKSGQGLYTFGSQSNMVDRYCISSPIINCDDTACCFMTSNGVEDILSKNKIVIERIIISQGKSLYFISIETAIYIDPKDEYNIVGAKYYYLIS